MIIKIYNFCSLDAIIAVGYRVNSKETTKNISLTINRLDGELGLLKTVNERVFYFIDANVDFIIDGDKNHLEDGDVLYLSKDTNYSAIGKFEAVVINLPAFGVIRK